MIIWFGKCDGMDIKAILKNIPKVKYEVTSLRQEYNEYLQMSDKLSGLCPSASKKYLEMSEEVYTEIQKSLSEYKRVIVAVKSIPDLKGMLLQLHYFEGHPIKNIADMMNYRYNYLKKVEEQALNDLEKILMEKEGAPK